jgi:hypothetical protein
MTAAVYGDKPGGEFVQHVDSQAFATSGVVKATPGVFFEVNGFNSSASTRYFHVYNSATVPGDGAVPACIPITVPPSSPFSFSFAKDGIELDTGISWACSTSFATKTLGAAEMWTTISYK